MSKTNDLDLVELGRLERCLRKKGTVVLRTETLRGLLDLVNEPGRKCQSQLTGLNITGSVSAVLRLGETEGSHVDVEGTGLRLIREDGEVELVEVNGSGGRVIRRATATEAR